MAAACGAGPLGEAALQGCIGVDGALDERFLDQDDVRDEIADDRQGQPPDRLHGDALRERRPADRSILAANGVVEGRKERGLDADDLDLRLQRLSRHGDAGDQAAAADRHDDEIEVGELRQHLQGDGALAGHDERIVVDGWTKDRRSACASAWARSADSDKVSPCRITRAPCARVFSTFTSGVETGMTIVAGICSRRAW